MGILENSFHDAPVEKVYCPFRTKTAAKLWSWATKSAVMEKAHKWNLNQRPYKPNSETSRIKWYPLARTPRGYSRWGHCIFQLT
jgi:hypothetical protein